MSFKAAQNAGGEENLGSPQSAAHPMTDSAPGSLVGNPDLPFPGSSR